MVYGIASGFFRGVSLPEALDGAREAGFGQVELLCADIPPGLWFRNPAAARCVLEAEGMRVRTVHSHLAGWDNGNPDDAARRASVRAAAESFGPAAEVGADTVVVHANSGAHAECYVAERFEENLRRSRASLEDLARAAEKVGVRMAVENLPARGLPRPSARMADVLELIRGLGEHVGVCLDAGHANASGRNPSDEARLAGDRVLCVHLQDNDGLGEDQHLRPGEGTVDWPVLLDTLDEVAPDSVRTFEVGCSDEHRPAVLRALGRLRAQWEARTEET